jgi:hypothetical protein
MVDAKKDESPTPDTRNLRQRLLAVMAEVGYIQKEGATQSGPRFTYVKHDDVMALVRPALVKHGVFALVGMTDKEPARDVGKTSSGNTVWMTQLTIAVSFLNVDDPTEEPLVVNYPGTGVDTGDKGEGKALSYALKYALLKTFLIESGDEADNEAAHIETRPAAPAPPPASPQNNKLRAFWATARGNVSEDAVRLYFKRNFGVESTKDATPEQLADATLWAKMVGQASKKLAVEVTASGLVETEPLTQATQMFGVTALEELTLKEWNELTAWVAGKKNADPDDDIPF